MAEPPSPWAKTQQRQGLVLGSLAVVLLISVLIGPFVDSDALGDAIVYTLLWVLGAVVMVGLMAAAVMLGIRWTRKLEK